MLLLPQHVLLIVRQAGNRNFDQFFWGPETEGCFDWEKKWPYKLISYNSKKGLKYSLSGFASSGATTIEFNFAAWCLYVCHDLILSISSEINYHKLFKVFWYADIFQTSEDPIIFNSLRIFKAYIRNYYLTRKCNKYLEQLTRFSKGCQIMSRRKFSRFFSPRIFLRQ